ncbi:hypothetical protein BA724_03150 [Domibacillus iocasae]|uniref:YqbF C-terminal domain-containing protein n=2 Tax=Domibacillus iocasae TaxID=1714016 RepID=A0A1E7DS22_9BACI|nr:hypothetical protein BA724_03150 [Domibacillus iocasae]
MANTQKEADEIMETGYFELVESATDEGVPGNTPPSGEKHTKTSLKKLSAEEQKDLIIELGGEVEGTNNEDERVALILQLQEAGE